MKIAVVHNLPAGGQKRALYEQVKRLSKRHKIDLFSLSTADEKYLPLKPFIGRHVVVDYYPPPKFPKSVFSIYRELPVKYKELSDMVNSGGYDLAYVQPCYLTQAPYILQYLEIPSLYSCPEPKREFYEKIPRVSNRLTYALTYPFRKPIKRIDFANTVMATKVVTLSKYSQNRLRRVYHIEPLLNYLGVDAALFKPVDVPKENLVITVGSLSLHKGHDFLIRSLGKVERPIRPTLMIVGPIGVEINYLLKLSDDYGVNCEIVNNLPDSELVVWLNKANIFLGGAINEPFGLAILEALSCGTSVLAVNEGGVPEILENKDLGMLTERNEEEFAERITQILKSKTQTDRDYLHEYVKKRWSWESSVRNLEKIMEEMIS